MAKRPKQPAIVKLYPGTRRVLDDQDKFLTLIGGCITAWSFVDRELFRIFALHLGATERRAATVYYRWRDVRSRLDLVDTLLKQELAASIHRVKWRPLYIALSNLLTVRSVIAHQPPVRTGTSRGGQAMYLYSIHIEPAEAMVKPFATLAGRKQLGPKDLRDHIDQVEQLRAELRTLHTVLARHKRQRGA